MLVCGVGNNFFFFKFILIFFEGKQSVVKFKFFRLMVINFFECYSEGDYCENQVKGVECIYMVYIDKICFGSEFIGMYCV